MRLRVSFALRAISLGSLVTFASALAADDTFKDDYSSGLGQWKPLFAEGAWSAREGVLTSAEPKATTARLAKIKPVADAVVETEVRVADNGRRNFGIVFRATDDGTCHAVRYYDSGDRLELLGFAEGRPLADRIQMSKTKLDLKAGQWYRLKAAAVDDRIVAKIWPSGTATEPDWQLRAQCPDKRAGLVGLLVDDGSRIDFGAVRIAWGAEVEAMRKRSAEEQAARLKRLENDLKLQVDITPFVVRSQEGPKRRILVGTLLEGRPEPVDGKLEAVMGAVKRTVDLKAAQFEGGAYELLVPEPQAAATLEVSFTTSFGKRFADEQKLDPVRQWTFHMTPHTHYDIGFTEPQPEVIERLSRDMEAAVRFCAETADWPAESCYRWTVEVSSLFRNFAERHDEAQVARLIELVRQNRIEICGYYLNMPTELMGHEELIRCLYYSEGLRRRYGVTIDTAMINDVPGYAWALPQVLNEFGIRRVAFRANGIRGQFLWFRPGAVERPFYWEGPAGHRLFVWYTDSYREGNFFRAPGLHENEFLAIIRRNEAAGTFVDHIQLRMGGDNLPPEFNTSKNARAWNDKYVWPKVVVATNREYLDLLERRYGPRCKVYRGDIPSWWAEGPASSAAETGITRLLHDKLVAVEALWTLARLGRPEATYPAKEIERAYDRMIHYDEHTWGASCSIDRPKSPETQVQWQWKASCADDAQRLTGELFDRVVRHLSSGIPSTGKPSVAVWNTLTWVRTDLVELALVGTPFENATGLKVTDTRNGGLVASQVAAGGKTAWFVGREVPPLSHARYTIEPAESGRSGAIDRPTTIENRFYRLSLSADSASWSGCYDKELGRELLDRGARFTMNQPVFETAIGGRAAIDRKQPVDFKRTPAGRSTLARSQSGPVFSEWTTETSLPTCPRIEQTVRLYNDLKTIDVINVVDKEENFDTEGVYFAFPFDVPSPDIRFQIANTTMRPGKDQLTYTCHDFYSIQHWADVAGKGFGVTWVPIEAPLVVASDLNVYKWADTLRFDKGHLYSLVMNNYWSTNFKAGQSGTLTFRYRLTSYAGEPDPIRATHFAWQPFHPLKAAWLTKEGGGEPDGRPPITLEGDPAIISCVKMAEDGESVIVRLLELRGAASRCTLRFALPGKVRVASAFKADAVERKVGDLPVNGNAVGVELKANEIVTVGVVPR
ncbi:MAG TPA: glycoside hydrolase family 38 C-terminal domain-containing protein [Phycisphaerae bacterium]|nr:glycoside hydrolase family 38 C-terminal domain-containing protein [Phycisphaerae bacterium]HRY67122.1 glycoside hydrolase family 38 C-terminal domain-containing protein [Phycisphaerae bacterium]HSA26509.1 glycoside hydrolase family 38 C-terminal domain-containing protein [Phycisphaerae bacterium]